MDLLGLGDNVGGGGMGGTSKSVIRRLRDDLQGENINVVCYVMINKISLTLANKIQFEEFTSAD